LNIPILFRSILIGFAIAAPVGPIGILCIRRTLADGRRAGFISGLGAASADAVYGAIAAFGLTYISLFLINQSIWLRLGGGIFLIFLGLKTIKLKPGQEELQLVARNPNRLPGYYLSTFVLTISNPLTILSFTAIFAGIGAEIFQSENIFSASLMVLGIFLGSSFWWFLLSFLVNLLRSRFISSFMVWINRLAGRAISGFGIVILLSTISV
jgi:threonine/homoserine/homoserine lactone efflux protein